jgi:two-component system cell cycle sensor histidine kinase/response regulator CckA
MVMADLLIAEQETNIRRAQARNIHSISTAELHWLNTIFSEGNPPSLSRVLQKMNALVEFVSAALLVGTDGEEATCQASVGLSLREVREWEEWLNGPGREAWETAEKPRRLNGEDGVSGSGTAGRGSALLVPLCGRNGRLGVLLLNGAPTAQFSQRDMHIVSLLAGQIGLRLENRSLEDRESHRSSRIEDLLGRANIPYFVLAGDGTLLRVNRAFRTLIGADAVPDAALPNFFTGIIHPAEEGPRLKHLVEHGDIIDHMELQVRRADGTAIPVVLGSQAVRNSEGRITGHEAILTDVTSKKLAAEQIVRNQAMASVGQMTYNNLITGIMGCASMMLSQLDPDHPLTEDLQAVVSASVKASDLAGHLLAYSRGECRPSKTASVNDIVGETLRIIRNLFDGRIEIRWTPSPRLATIRGDATRIQQAVMNICLNASDAMSDGGILSIESENAALDPEAAARFGVEPGEYVRLRIADTGCGMEPRTLNRIFEPYFTTKGDKNGNGLGLAITLEAVRMHRGGITASSRKGKGTTFEMVFPVQKESPAETAVPARTADPRLPSGGETVLFVDDEEVIRRMGKRMLEKFGYRVIVAGDGEEAVRLAEQKDQRIDLMIVDKVMPRIDGAETLRQVREIRPDMKALLTSGYGLPDPEAPGRDGFLGFLPKPFMIEQMLQLIRKSLDGPVPLMHA